LKFVAYHAQEHDASHCCQFVKLKKSASWIIIMLFVSYAIGAVLMATISSQAFLEHLQEFAKIYLANPVFCQLLKNYAK
jgi:hypothetical protein